MLLFLYNTGARASEAAHLTVGDLDLGTSAFVRILGKGRKIRLCPLWPHTAKILRALLGPRLEGPPEAMVFLNVRGAPITRFGIHSLVERIAKRTSKQMPSLQQNTSAPIIFDIPRPVICCARGSTSTPFGIGSELPTAMPRSIWK